MNIWLLFLCHEIYCLNVILLFIIKIIAIQYIYIDKQIHLNYLKRHYTTIEKNYLYQKFDHKFHLCDLF